jgi:hypothetical protein
MEIREVSIKKLKPAKYNPRKDLQPDDPEYIQLEKSIKEFGNVDPIIWNEKTGNIIGGHQRFKILSKGLNGNSKLSVSVVNLSERKEKMLNIALNKISGDWDEQKLNELVVELNIDGFDLDLIGFNQSEIDGTFGDIAEVYSRNIEAPIYNPKGEKPEIESLFDDKKSDELIAEINEYNVGKDIKKFLIMAARRHVVFNYGKIAEYYCHAEKKVQVLMENSGLVIIDFNRAIELGYVKLSESIAKQYKAEHEG